MPKDNKKKHSFPLTIFVKIGTPTEIYVKYSKNFIMKIQGTSAELLQLSDCGKPIGAVCNFVLRTCLQGEKLLTQMSVSDNVNVM